MQKTALLSIAVVASLVTAAIAQSAPEPEPAWRASALALVPAGFVAGEAYRTADMTGYLAVYPASANDPKSPASVFAARQVLVVRLDKDEQRALSAELKPRSDATRGNRDTTMTDPDGQESEFAKSHAELAAKRATLPEGTEPCRSRRLVGRSRSQGTQRPRRAVGEIARARHAAAALSPEDGWQ